MKNPSIARPGDVQTPVDESRRQFLKVSATAGGALLIGIYFSGCQKRASEQSVAPSTNMPEDFEPNAWIQVNADDTVIIRVASSEMGQGVMTAIPMLIAEELDADWTKVKPEFAPVNTAYNNPIIGRQMTGGSTAVRGFWNVIREAGAVGRDMFITAAAQTWGVSPDSCHAQAGTVIHKTSGKMLRYGELTAKAATLPVPKSAFVKESSEFRIVGKPLPRLDTPVKVDGSAIFGQDVKVPGMLVASVLRCPVFGGVVKTFNADKAKAVKGVRHVVQIGSGIGIVAEGFWAAKQGRDALEVQWHEGRNAKLDSAAIRNQLMQAVDKGVQAHKNGDIAPALKSASKVIEAVYEVPYLAHACMEPMNCTAHVRGDGCDIWVPTQGQSATLDTAMRITGLPAEKINVHTTYLGGGFGRRGEQDFVADCVELSKAVGAPVKVMWTREDDMQHDYYRPTTANRLAGGIDAEGMPIAWRHQIAGPSILATRVPNAVKNGLDGTATEGAANLPYGIANILVTYAMTDPGVPVGFWRSVGSSQNAFITESFFDELAAAGGKDPYELRRMLLKDKPRHKRVLELAANKAAWGSPLPEGHARGIAVAEAFGSFVAQVAEVSIEKNQVRVHRVVCAVDCGITVNPGIIAAQMESGIVYGLTAALKGEITVADGRVQQSNFHDYPLLRIDEMPEVEVHIVASGEHPGGVGEPGTPPIAPAVANAVFALTGKPVRALPIRLAT